MSTLSIQKQGALLHLVLKDEHHQNLLTGELLTQLHTIFTTLDKGVKCVLFTQESDNFCMGGQLGDVRTQTALDISIFAEQLLNAFTAIANSKVPTICTLKGRTNGGGICLLEAFDLSYCDESATFSIAEIDNHMSPVLSFAGASRTIPQKKVMEMALLGKVLTAKEGKDYGLVSDIVAPEQMDTFIQAVVDRLCSENPSSILAIKTLKKNLSHPSRLSDYTLAALSLPQAIHNTDVFNTKNAQDQGKTPVY